MLADNEYLKSLMEQILEACNDYFYGEFSLTKYGNVWDEMNKKTMTWNNFAKVYSGCIVLDDYFMNYECSIIEENLGFKNMETYYNCERLTYDKKEDEGVCD